MSARFALFQACSADLDWTCAEPLQERISTGDCAAPIIDSRTAAYRPIQQPQ
jgi:hypothetical protein